jgi:hypothetical protein
LGAIQEAKGNDPAQQSPDLIIDVRKGKFAGLDGRKQLFGRHLTDKHYRGWISGGDGNPAWHFNIQASLCRLQSVMSSREI